MPATAARSTGDEMVELRTGMPVNQRRANASRELDRRLGPYRGGIPKQTAAPMPEPRFRERFIDGSRAPLRTRLKSLVKVLTDFSRGVFYKHSGTADSTKRAPHDTHYSL